MSESNGGTSGEELGKAIEDAEVVPGSSGLSDDDDGSREAVRIAVNAVAGAAFRDERGRLLSGYPAQWKPGQSGNPTGQPTEAQKLKDFVEGRRKKLPDKLMTEALRHVLDDPLVRQKLAEKWVLASAKNPGYAKMILERLEGKVPYTVRLGPEVDAESQTDLAISVVDVQLTAEDPMPVNVVEGGKKDDPPQEP